MNIAVIPARGGSKRIPRKNIKNFYGKPIISYSIEAAINSGCFDRIVVSTDDEEIAEISLKYGAEIPFSRPKNISDDFSTTLDVMQHAVIELNLPSVGNVCCLYATAPFITPQQLIEALAILSESQLDYVFSAAEYPFPIQRAFHLTKENRVRMFQPEHFSTRSQDLLPAYHDAGQFYWGSCTAFRTKRQFFTEKSRPLILPLSQVQDIDTLEDWDRAELMFSLTEKKRERK